MLKYKIDNAAFETLNDVEKSFYKQNGDDYQLEVEGATDKNKLDEFRQKNIDLMKSQEQFKGVDMDKIRALQEQERKLLDAEFIDKKDFDGLIESRTNAMKSDYESKLSSLTQQMEEVGNKYKSTVSKYEIEGAASKAFTSHKIAPEAHDAMMAQVKNKFSIDNGRVVALEDGQILAGENGNLTVDEYVSAAPEIFKIQSSGGAGKGADGHSMSTGTTSRDKITAGLNKLAK